ncbi:hypothetical protein HanXRQr2_Chr05g0199961 [Helianthus annuus]|uniref:Uncharacterized protein n=1 Tax=Helianthus annuus TaxID=4232 RepID=A0A251UMW9_HELAN|nr:hypothetical protein HanXRQr2_Chr05g0199961 [Helianthus annuus]KAJ0921544.1 hypothetical protein HanPSC8_Chr05g0192791 [Helianthus annuus]
MSLPSSPLPKPELNNDGPSNKITTHLTYLTELLKGKQDHNPREAINALNVVLKEASSLINGLCTRWAIIV